MRATRANVSIGGAAAVKRLVVRRRARSDWQPISAMVARMGEVLGDTHPQTCKYRKVLREME